MEQTARFNHYGALSLARQVVIYFFK